MTQPLGVIICGPCGFTVRTSRPCETCKTVRRMVGLDEIYHGLSWTCLGCGDSWADGCRSRRPTEKNWRLKARKKARTKWKTAKPLGGPEHRAWEEAEWKAMNE